MNTNTKPYGTYQRFQYNTAPLPSIDWMAVAATTANVLRSLALALAWVTVIVAGCALAYAVTLALPALLLTLVAFAGNLAMLAGVAGLFYGLFCFAPGAGCNQPRWAAV